MNGILQFEIYSRLYEAAKVGCAPFPCITAFNISGDGQGDPRAQGYLINLVSQVQFNMSIFPVANVWSGINTTIPTT